MRFIVMFVTAVCMLFLVMYGKLWKKKETLFMHAIQFKAGSLWGRVGEMNVGFWGEGKTGVPGEKPLGAGKRTNKLSPHETPDLRIEPGSHWWEASALTTTPSLQPPPPSPPSLPPWTVTKKPITREKTKPQTVTLISLCFLSLLIGGCIMANVKTSRDPFLESPEKPFLKL